MDGFSNFEIAIPTKATAADRHKGRIIAKNALYEKILCNLRKEQSEDFVSILRCFYLKLG